MMFHFCEQDFLTLLNKLIAPTARNEVDAGGGSCREDHFRGPRGIDPDAYFFSGFFVAIRTLITEPMNASMYICKVLFVHFGERLDDVARALRRGRVVQVYQRFVAVD